MIRGGVRRPRGGRYVSVDIVDFAPEHVPGVERLWERMYERPRSASFYRWSLLDAPGHRALVAMDGVDCVAMLRAFDREYLLDNRRVLCRETFDWLCAPEHRPHALGLRVMRVAMSDWAPLVNVGGSEDSLGILPALRWASIGQASSYALPLRRELLSLDTVERLPYLPQRARGPALTAAAALWFRPRRRPCAPRWGRSPRRIGGRRGARALSGVSGIRRGCHPRP